MESCGRLFGEGGAAEEKKTLLGDCEGVDGVEEEVDVVEEE
jgi:hypothetical protein